MVEIRERLRKIVGITVFVEECSNGILLTPVNNPRPGLVLPVVTEVTKSYFSLSNKRVFSIEEIIKISSIGED